MRKEEGEGADDTGRKDRKGLGKRNDMDILDHLYDKHLGQGWRNYTFSRLQTNIRVHGSTLRIQLDTRVSSGKEFRLRIRFKLKVQGSA